jgi:hypothetical protein
VPSLVRPRRDAANPNAVVIETFAVTVVNGQVADEPFHLDVVC